MNAKKIDKSKEDLCTVKGSELITRMHHFEMLFTICNHFSFLIFCVSRISYMPSFLCWLRSFNINLVFHFVSVCNLIFYSNHCASNCRKFITTPVTLWLHEISLSHMVHVPLYVGQQFIILNSFFYTTCTNEVLDEKKTTWEGELKL